jgi:hypothetical protein
MIIVAKSIPKVAINNLKKLHTPKMPMDLIFAIWEKRQLRLKFLKNTLKFELSLITMPLAG